MHVGIPWTWINTASADRQSWKTLAGSIGATEELFPVLLLMVPLQEREGGMEKFGWQMALWMGTARAGGGSALLRRVSGGMKGLHLFQLDLGCAGGKKKGHRALSEKSSSLSKVQAEDALKQGGEEVAMKLDTCRGPSRSPAEGEITAGPGCNSAEILVPAKMFLGNKLFSTAREGERTLGRGSADGASGIWDAEVSRRENNSSRQRI